MHKKYDDNILDIFRIFATAQVFAGHVVTHLLGNRLGEKIYIYSKYIHFIRGVPVLLILSGFLAAKSLDTQNAREWLVRRAARLLPAYWVCVSVNTVIIFSIYSLPPSFRSGIIYAATQFTGLNFYTGSWLRGYGVGAPNGVLWTISVQIQFFILAPLIYKLIKKLSLPKALALTAGLACLSILCRRSDALLPEALYKLAGVSVFPYLYFLVFGMAAWRFRDRLIPALEKCRWLLAAVYVLWRQAENNIRDVHWLDGYHYNTVTTLLLACVIFGFAFRHQWRCAKDYTYGFYLYQMVFVNLAVELGFSPSLPDGRQIWASLGVFGMTALFAVLSKSLVEEPAAKLAKGKG